VESIANRKKRRDPSSKHPNQKKKRKHTHTYTYNSHSHTRMSDVKLINVGELLSACVDAAQRAGDEIRKVWKSGDLQIKDKGGTNPHICVSESECVSESVSQ
jgi:hypothetical protein